MERQRPGRWVGPRGVALLLVAAVLAGVLARMTGPLAALAIVAVIVAAAFGADTRAGAAAFAVRRIAPSRFALARRDVLRYEVENHAAVALRFGIVEAPVERLGLPLEGLEGVLAARSHATVELAFVPRERGRTALGTTYAWYETAFGLIRHRVRRDDPCPIRVMPDLSALDRSSDLALRTRLIETGLRRLRQRGLGTEFASLRDYAAGDEFRSIDWKASARRDRVMVVQHEIERSQRVMIALDAGRLMSARLDDRRKLDFAVAAGLALATLAQLAGDRVGVHAFAARTLAAIAPAHGAAHAARVADALADLEPQFEESDYERAAIALGDGRHKRSLMVVFTDLFDPVASAALLAALGILTRRHLVVIALMNDAAIADALEREPAHAADAYRASVAARLGSERERALAHLRARGMLVVDVPAPRLSLALLDAYVEIKTRQLL